MTEIEKLKVAFEAAVDAALAAYLTALAAQEKEQTDD
jgi:hypothetical protein